ncbi:MAG: Trk system potassium transporter TrkA [Gammaproteobacteria bacterium AqS3]|nr:Trk system potassium transporter TrkA [Gammaproteobacteria bacterium AqS3]
MNILILGAGKVGRALAEILSREPDNDVSVIDLDPDRVEQVKRHSEITALVGSACYESDLKKANIERADIVIACTRSDEINLLACDVAKRMFGVPDCIARLHSEEFDNYMHRREMQSGSAYQIDQIIRPEGLITEQFLQLILHTNALQVKKFVKDRLSLVAVRAVAGSRGGLMVGQDLRSLGQTLERKYLETRVVAIYRQGQALEKISGETTIEQGDEVFFLAESNFIDEVIHEMHTEVRRPHHYIAIAGCTKIGISLAQILEERTDIEQVKILDVDRNRCEMAADKLKSAIVLHGDAGDSNMFEVENLSHYDVFCALTEDDEHNIMSAMLARQRGVRKVIALVSNPVYSELIESDKIDVLVSPAAITTSELLQHIRGANVELVHSLRYGLAEALEIVVQLNDAMASEDPVVGKRFKEIDLPPKVTVGAVVRGEEVFLQSAYLEKELRLEVNDRVVLFLSDREVLSQVAKLFSFHQ